jgi:hypothetical protein
MELWLLAAVDVGLQKDKLCVLKNVPSEAISFVFAIKCSIFPFKLCIESTFHFLGDGSVLMAYMIGH